MYRTLDLSTADIPSGVPPQRKLFIIETGAYAGRLFCLYNESPSTIAYTYADPPYTIWSSPYNQVTDSADYPPSACIDSEGNIYIIYVQQTTLNLIFFKMPFAGGMWLSGAPYTVLDEGLAYYPVISRNNDGELWCGFAYYDSSADEYEVRVKYSADGGGTWGSGSSDTGSLLQGELSSMPYISLTCMSSYVLAAYSANRSSLYLQRYAAAWETAMLVYSGDYIDADFDCAVSSDMKLGIVFTPSSESKVYFREYDGVSLGGLYEVYDGEAKSPQVRYESTEPYIYFAAAVGNSRHKPMCAVKDSTSFSSTDLVKNIGLLDSFLLYEYYSCTYEDKTDEAASDTSSDIYHSTSSVMLATAGDIAYFGKQSKFFCLSIVLSLPATGGSIVWEYYDGQDWVEFSPYSGDSALDEAETVIYLWSDMANVPDSWQMSTVNDITHFWVRARVNVDMTVAPVGSQIVAVPKCDYLSLMRGSA